MTITEFLLKQDPLRKELMTALHEIILKTNKKVIPEVGMMMRTDMILYKIDNQFEYGLGSQKNYMSLHAMPLYIEKSIHAKYSKLLNKAKFQKGCINFKSVDEMPLDIAEQLLTDCAKINWKEVMEKNRK